MLLAVDASRAWTWELVAQCGRERQGGDLHQPGLCSAGEALSTWGEISKHVLLYPLCSKVLQTQWLTPCSERRMDISQNLLLSGCWLPPFRKGWLQRGWQKLKELKGHLDSSPRRLRIFFSTIKLGVLLQVKIIWAKTFLWGQFVS